MKKNIFYALSMILLLAGYCEAADKVYIDLSAPAAKRLPIAVQEFKNLGSTPVSPADEELIKKTGKELIETLRSDLNFSRLFNIIDSSAYIEDPKAGITETNTDFQKWRAVGADTLIKGGFILDKNLLTAEFRFFDCFKEKQLFGKRYIGSSANPRRLAHYFADQLYEELTGRKGIFTTKIIFISDRGGDKDIYLSDYDGKNIFQITRNKSINISPQWSPDGKLMAYTSYKKGWPCIYMLDLRTGKETVVSDKPGVNIGGRFSPDNLKMAFTISTNKSSYLYLKDLATGELKRLTDNYGINVSPTWSPDGKQIAYVSDTAGNPHIFVLDLVTGKSRRMTYDGKYNSSPAWSPDGRQIAFARSDTGRFNIWVMRPDGSGSTQLTFSGDARTPSWSPDGRHIIFSSMNNGTSSLYIMQADGTGITKIDAGPGNFSGPVWSPFLQ